MQLHWSELPLARHLPANMHSVLNLLEMLRNSTPLQWFCTHLPPACHMLATFLATFISFSTFWKNLGNDAPSTWFWSCNFLDTSAQLYVWDPGDWICDIVNYLLGECKITGSRFKSWLKSHLPLLHNSLLFQPFVNLQKWPTTDEISYFELLDQKLGIVCVPTCIPFSTFWKKGGNDTPSTWFCSCNFLNTSSQLYVWDPGDWISDIVKLPLGRE